MAQNSGSKKILIYYIHEILRRYSDINHKLTQNKISTLIKDIYEVDCDRKSVSRNINALINAGIDIETYGENGEGYYLRESLFTDSEIRMLIDSVMASRYISSSYTKRLIEKLSKLSTIYFSKKNVDIDKISEWVHTDNPHVFLNIEILDEAIYEKKKVSFIYNRYGLDKKLHPRSEEAYEVDPYQIICDNGRYYLLGYYKKYNKIVGFRLNLITDVRAMEEGAIPFKKINSKAKSIEDYSKYLINMYDGKKIRAVIRIKENRIGDVIDWFGKEIKIKKDTGEYVKVEIAGTDNGIRMWGIQYGRIVEVLEPAYLRETIRKDIEEMLVKYS